MVTKSLRFAVERETNNFGFTWTARRVHRLGRRYRDYCLPIEHLGEMGGPMPAAESGLNFEKLLALISRVGDRDARRELPGRPDCPAVATVPPPIPPPPCARQRSFYYDIPREQHASAAIAFGWKVRSPEEPAEAWEERR